MKKIISCLLVFSMIFVFMACGKPSDVTEKNVEKQQDIVETERDTNSVSTEGETEESNNSEYTESEQESSHILVAYFSATGTTKGVAEKIAEGLLADIYEITPQDSYTEADLNYNDNNSRSTKEMNDPDARPEIAGSIENMDQYDIVFVGYPIWWSDAPRIVSTFMENYDFSGKTIIPFCTSGGSGIGSSAANLESLTSGANWLEGKRLNGSDTQETIMEWVNSLELNQ